MAWSPWLLAVLVLVPAIQVPAVLYLSRYVALDDDEELPDLPTGYATPPDQWNLQESETVRVPDRVACPACGAGNDTAYRYCRACASRLGGA